MHLEGHKLPGYLCHARAACILLTCSENTCVSISSSAGAQRGHLLTGQQCSSQMGWLTCLPEAMCRQVAWRDSLCGLLESTAAAPQRLDKPEGLCRKKWSACCTVCGQHCCCKHNSGCLPLHQQRMVGCPGHKLPLKELCCSAGVHFCKISACQPASLLVVQ